MLEVVEAREVVFEVAAKNEPSASEVPFLASLLTRPDVADELLEPPPSSLLLDKSI